MSWHEHLDKLPSKGVINIDSNQPSSFASWLSYIFSVALAVMGEILETLGHYATGIGVLLGIATYFTNFYYQRKNSMALIAKQQNEIENEK